MVSWFGYKLHLIVNAVYELPVEYAVTKASVAEQPIAHEMLTKMEKDKGEILERCEYFDGDKGYDDGKLVGRLYDDFDIKPVIYCQSSGFPHPELQIGDVCFFL